MKLCRYFAATLAALVVSVSMSDLLSACDLCRGRTPCRACGTSDNQGLLDALDRAANRMRPTLPRLNMPRLPAVGATLQFVFGGAVGCRSCATCGCEATETGEATCGCELREPSCGCELHESCNCHTHADASPPSSHHQHAYDSPPIQRGAQTYAQPQMAPRPAPTPVPQATPYVEPYAPNERYNSPAETYRQPAPYHELQPMPQRVPETVPLPDNKVDPFRDDAATRIRKIPSRTIQYRQPEAAYRQNYDPQASNEPYHARLSDDAPAASPRLALDDQSSSRSRGTRAAGPAFTAEPQRLPAVVTASSIAPQNASPIEQRNPLR